MSSLHTPLQSEVSSALCSLNNSDFSLLTDQLRDQLVLVQLTHWIGFLDECSPSRENQICLLNTIPPFLPPTHLHTHTQGCSPVDQLQELNELLSLDQVLTLLQLGNSSLFSSSTSSTMGWEQFFCGESGGDFGELQGTVNRVILGNSYQQGQRRPGVHLVPLQLYSSEWAGSQSNTIAGKQTSF